MSHYYFDSSALVKRYVIEDGTDWVQVLCRDEANTVYTARISAAEIVAAFFCARAPAPFRPILPKTLCASSK